MEKKTQEVDMNITLPKSEGKLISTDSPITHSTALHVKIADKSATLIDVRSSAPHLSHVTHLLTDCALSLRLPTEFTDLSSKTSQNPSIEAPNGGSRSRKLPFTQEADKCVELGLYCEHMKPKLYQCRFTCSVTVVMRPATSRA